MKYYDNPGKALMALDVLSGGASRATIAYESCGVKKECPLTVTKTSSSDPGSPCSQLAESKCDEKDGTLLKLVNVDCTETCLCATLDKNGNMKLEAL